MLSQLLAIGAGIAGGAVVLFCLYLLAARKAATSGERAVVIWLRGLAFLSVVHGLGLVFVIAAVLVAVTIWLGPLPELDVAFMTWKILAGCGFVIAGGTGLATFSPSRR